MENLNNEQVYEIIQGMLKRGSHFYVKLAMAMEVADGTTRKKILDAFPELIKYAEYGK